MRQRDRRVLWVCSVDSKGFIYLRQKGPESATDMPIKQWLTRHKIRQINTKNKRFKNRQTAEMDAEGFRWKSRYSTWDKNYSDLENAWNNWFGSYSESRISDCSSDHRITALGVALHSSEVCALSSALLAAALAASWHSRVSQLSLLQRCERNSALGLRMLFKSPRVFHAAKWTQFYRQLCG